MVAPILDEIAKEYAGQLIVAKVSIDENPRWAEKFRVRALPTTLFIKDGEEVDCLVEAPCPSSLSLAKMKPKFCIQMRICLVCTLPCEFARRRENLFR